MSERSAQQCLGAAALQVVNSLERDAEHIGLRRLILAPEANRVSFHLLLSDPLFVFARLEALADLDARLLDPDTEVGQEFPFLRRLEDRPDSECVLSLGSCPRAGHDACAFLYC